MIEHDELRLLVQQIVKESVLETLHTIGFDTKNMHEVQADLRYLNKTRKGSEFVSMRLKAAIIATLVPTVLYVLWEAVKQIISRNS